MLSESFGVEVGVDVKRGCGRSPGLFIIYKDGFMREMKDRVEDLGSRLKVICM